MPFVLNFSKTLPTEVLIVFTFAVMCYLCCRNSLGDNFCEQKEEIKFNKIISFIMFKHSEILISQDIRVAILGIYIIFLERVSSRRLNHWVDLLIFQCRSNFQMAESWGVLVSLFSKGKVVSRRMDHGETFLFIF